MTFKRLFEGELTQQARDVPLLVADAGGLSWRRARANVTTVQDGSEATFARFRLEYGGARRVTSSWTPDAELVRQQLVNRLSALPDALTVVKEGPMANGAVSWIVTFPMDESLGGASLSVTSSRFVGAGTVATCELTTHGTPALSRLVRAARRIWRRVDGGESCVRCDRSGDARCFARARRLPQRFRLGV